MKFNFKFSANRCKCGNDISKQIKEFLENLEVVYSNHEYDEDESEYIVCEKCCREYYISTGYMLIDIYKNPIEMDYCAICNKLTRIDDMNECHQPGDDGIINYICDDCESNYP